MGPNKLSALIFLFVALMAAAPIAQAQLGGLGGLLGGLLGVIRINGNISCSLNGSPINGVATPAFANALVQLQCGENVVSSARTNQDGVFSILLDPMQNILSTLLSGCNIVVKTPLSTCNASLPSIGGLVSSGLKLVSTISGLLNISNLIPGSFQFLPNIN